MGDLPNYDLNYSKRGLVYIIVNEIFKSKDFSDRIGAYTDYKNMKKLFKPLGFKLMTYYDKTAKEMKNIMENASKRPDLAERPCFICIISSHGEQWPADTPSKTERKLEHVIVGVDGKRVRTEELVEPFSDRRCPEMVGKPKMFFIQACRENIYGTDRKDALDPGVNIEYIPVVSAKLSKYRHMRQRITGHNPDSSDSKPEQPGLSDGLLHEILDKKDEEEDDGFSDEYDTSTTDDESDEDEDREKGHEEIRKRDRSSYHKETDQPQTETKDQNVEDQSNQRETRTSELKEETPFNEEVEQDQTDAGGKSTMKDSKSYSRQHYKTEIKQIEPVEMVSIPCHDDMLVMFASPPGKLAWRSTTEGGWLLANLYNVMKQYVYDKSIKDRDLLRILTEVSQDVSFRETNTDDPEYDTMKMVPVIYHKLTRDVMLCTCKETKLFQKIKEKLTEFLIS